MKKEERQKRINSLTLNKKFFLYGFRFFAPVFLLITLMISIIFLINKIRDEKINSLSKVKSVSLSISLIQEEIKKLSTYVCINNDVIKILTTDDVEKTNANSRLWYDKAPIEFVEDLIALNGDIKTLAIYPENGVRPFLRGMDGSVNQPTINMIRTLKSYSSTMKSENKMIWQFVEKNTRGTYEVNREDKIVFYREMYDLKNKFPLCFIAIGINVETFANVCDNAKQKPDEKFVVFNSFCEELCDVDRVDPNIKNHIQRQIFKMLNDNNDTVQFWYKGNYVTCCKLNRTSSVVCNVIPFKDYYGFIISNSTVFVICLFVFMITLYLLLKFMSRFITEPISKLSSAIKKVSRGDFTQQIEVNSSDEIGQVALVFNKMVKDINNLINENYVIHLKEKENEIASLQAQINPHFLYNTLNSLYWQAINADNEELAENILALSRLFQLVLSQGKKEFLVEDEFELLGHYLEIQKMRFNDKLKYEINLEDSIKKYFLPKLIIQPFVENSIEHGFVNKTTECNIMITGKEKDSMMEFEIIDTGSGMTDEKIKELLSGKETSRHERIGSYAIKNIIDRLKLLYRDNHVFEIESIIGRGTKVKIIIPKERNLK